MINISPFQGLVPAPDFVDRVNCVPYDVLNTQEALTLAQGNPYSLLHVDRAEIDLPPETDIYSDAVYSKAKENFLRLQNDGALVRESSPSLYLYRQIMGAHSQTGLAAACHVDDYENNLIKKHEKTRPDKEDDRTRLIDTIGATTGPVFLTYRDERQISLLSKKIESTAPTYDFTAPDGIRHTVWRITETQEFVDAFKKNPVVYIADGHHRAASAARVAKLRRARNSNHRGDEPYNRFLAVFFPSSHLKILPYNRVVLDLNSLSSQQFLEKIRLMFDLKETVSSEPSQQGQICMYLQKKWYAFQCPPPAPNATPIERLDVTVLQEKILAPILGIDDPRTSSRIEFVGGIRGTAELIKKVDSAPQSAVAFSMFPTTVEQMMDIADADQIMPPKSTWFEPKLRSGFFIHTF
ncbi:MAG: DUF1015 domain-containing protein [Verrucomicrobiota bacterium]